MATKIRTYHHTHSTRSVAIVMLRPPPLGYADPDTPIETEVATIAAGSNNGATFGPPTLSSCLDNNGNPFAFTHEQWEDFKREAADAWNVYEATWPTAGDIAECLSGQRHKIDVMPPEPMPLCTVCGKYAAPAVIRELHERRVADISAAALKWIEDA